MYSGKKVFVVLLSVMLMSSLALAATFSAGGGQGVSTVGTLGGEDYATLAAAATDFNTYAGGCTGDWTLQITSDLTETVNVYFGNATNGHTVTIRPAPGISPTVNLNGPSGTIGGHLGIGANADNFANLVKTDNFVINGCSDDAWSTRSLTLVNRLVSLANTRIVLVVGDSDNAVIKNCIINNRSTNATGNANVGVEFLTRYTNPDVFVPDNGIVENCDITASTNLGGYGTGIRQTTSVAPPAGNAQTGMIFRDNIINAGMYGIQLAQTAGADVYNNTIRLTQLTSGRQVYGILFSASNNTSNWTLNIYNNTIDKLQTVNTGASGIHLGAVVVTTAQTPVTYNVYNNMICGYNFTTAVNISNAYYYGIYCDSYCSTTTNRNVFLNFHHNSIYMPHFATLTYTTDANRRQRAYGLGCHAQISRARTIDFRNNNIRVEQAGAACVHPGIETTRVTRTINYNNLSADTANGAFTAFYNYAADYSTLADWQAALYKEYDQNSVAVDPLTAQAPLTGVWTAANNLLYTSYPSSSLHALPVTGITTDIKGAARSAVHPFMGCEEWQPTGPKAQLLTDGLNFGRALIQTAGGIPNAPKSLMIRNVGTSDLIISGVSYQSGSAEFTFSSVDSPIAPGATGSCTLLYTANTLGPVSAVFQIASNDAYEPNKNFDAKGEGGLTKKFSGFPIGRGPSLIGSGPGDDYATLYAAAADFNSVAGGCTGDWDVFITSDLTEPANVAFGNNVPTSYTVTIRPLAGVTPTINFTQTTVGAVPGHWVIGSNNPADLASLVKTDNFIINGCAGDAWSTRSLTIQNLNTASIANSRLILVYGDSDNFTIKNCNLINGSRSVADNGCTGVEFTSRLEAGISYIPDYGTVDNCSINVLSGTATTGRYGTGIKQFYSGTITSGQAQRGLTVRNCEIDARYVGIFLAQTAGADIHDNTIRLDQYSVSTYIYGIYFYAFNNAPAWSLNIFNNRIDKLQTVNYGATGIDLGTMGFTVAHTPITFNVYNNMICGFNFTTATPVSNVYYRGIYCDAYYNGNNNRDVFINICHNSIYMPHFANLTWTDNTTGWPRVQGIGFPTRTGNSRTIDVRNNNIRVEQNFAACLHPGISTAYATRTINYNNLSADTANGALTVRYNNTATVYPALADWQADLGREYDQNSMAINPFTAQNPPDITGVWTAADNLLYTSYPTPNLHALPVAGITTDIKGAPRSATQPFMGCEEWQPSGPKICLLTGNLDFGKALIQTAGGIPNAPKALIIKNVGTETLTISGVTYQSGSAEFAFDSVDTTLAPGATGSCTLLYTANTLGPVSATFQIASNDAYEPNKNFDAVGEGGLTKKFSGFPIGRGPSLIGSNPGDDYPTLYAAALDFNSVSGGCTGDWDVFITSDLTEPANVAFGNNVPTTCTVTIRPLAGVEPTINFTQTTVGLVPGHWNIGATNPADLASLVKTDNFIINGCADDAWSTRSMTIKNLDTVSITNSRLILVYGDSDNFTIKNCNLINGSRYTGDNGCTGVEFMSRNDTVSDYIPDYGTVDNCLINALSGTAATGRYGTGVKQYNSGTISVGQAQRGLTVSNCDINVRYIGVFMAQTAGADIHDNRIRVDQYSVSTYIYGIYFQTSRSATDWSMNIYNNTIDQLQTVNYGATGIFLNTEVYATTPATPIYFNVFNNMICGFNFTVGSPTTNIYYRGIYCDARSNTTANRDVYVNMYYNSVYMPHFPNLTYNTSGRNYVYAIGCNAATNYGRTVDIRNNNIRVEQYYSAGLNISMSTANYVVNCDYNNISADTANGALTGRYNTTFEYATLADWQTAESGRFDRNSVDVNPLAPQSPLTGVWTAADDLLYTAYPSTRLHSLPVTGITTDIKGVARSATQPFMGCEEWQPVGPKAHFMTYNLNFGNCLLLSEGGVVASKALVIKNIGTEDLVTSGVVFMSGSPLFVFDSIDSPIAPGATGNCVISYTPSTLGAFSATFRIATNDAYESDKILETVGAAKLTKKYSEFPVGRGPSLLGSGPDDDYATLAAAAADFNSVTGGSTGDWNVYITSDLTEPVNVAFGNATNGHKVTIRPRAGVSPLIDFTQTSTPVLGHWIIGATDHNDRASLVKTDNFIINGWSDDIGTTRGLTIRNRDSEIFNSRVILVYGDCDNFTIRNCNVINRSRSITDNGCTVVEFMSRNFDWVNNYIPDNGTVENCSISAVGPDAGSAKFGTGIKQSALGTITGKRAQADLTVKDCDINVRYTGVYLGQTAGAMIHDNTIRIDQPTPGTHIRAIWLNSANGSSGWTMDIFNNTIDQLNNFDTGISAIDLGNANYVGMHDPIMINVHNNMICGFNFTTPLLRSNVAYRGIYYDGGSTYDFTISFNCYFNSIYMPHFPKLSYTPGNTTSQRSAFAIGAPANYYGRVFDVRNNILRVEQKYAAAIHYMKYLNNTIVTCDYNNLSVDTANGAFTGRFSNLLVMTEYPSFADWQSAPDSPDQHSITMNPFDVYPPYTGNWTATNNLLFTSFPTTAMLGTSIPGITTDILGTARNAAVPFMGCHEPKASGPQMVLQPDSLDFGRCLVLAEDGSAITENIIISNLGIMDLVTSAVTFLGGSPDFSLISYEPNIASGASGLFTIRYTPVALGPQTATFRIHSNDPIVPVRDVVVQGVGRLTKMFSALPVGRGNSWVGNDPEADYQTLAEAAADFNAVAGGCTGDWNLWIITDLTEPDNVAFGNTIPVPFKVTIRPLAGVAPVVTFTQSGVGEVPGHLIIGAADSGDLDSLVKTDRFIINGCSDDAFSTKSLVIQNRDDAAIADSSLVLVAGDSDNAVIRNCILLNRSLSNAENGCTAVDFMSRNDGMNNFIPDNATIENCTITAQGGSGATGRYGTAVRQSGSGTITQGLAQTGLVVRDCAINARYAGILLGMTAGASIHDNTIQLNQLASGTHIRGIWLTSANRSSGWTLDIFNNTINRMVCVDTGITAIDLGGAVYTSAHTPITMNVYNNMICGFNFTATASVSNVIYRGVFYDGGSEFVAPIYFNCWFNSLYMPHFANLTYTPGTEAGRRAAFAIGAPAGQSYRILDIRDNIIRLEQNYAAAIHYMNYLDKTFTTCDYNDLSVDGTSGAFTGRYADASSITEYASLADWQGASGAPDEHSVSVNPFIATPPFTGTWTATDNLLFTSYNSTLLAGTPVTGITTDINGDLRHPLEPYMGCDEHYFGERPWVAITNSPTGILTEDVLVSFRIFASDSPACTIKVEYTTDGGATWVETTSLVGATTGLASSPAGVEHSITWKPIPDIGETDATCQLRITVRRDSTPDKWGTITGVTGEFSLRNAPAHAVIHYPAPADEGWVKSYGTLADGTFLSAVDGSFYIGTHSSGSGRLSIGAGISGTDNRNYVGGWQNPNTDIPYLEGNVYIAKFKVSTNQANTSNVPNTRLYAEFINSAGSLAAAGGNRVGKGPFAPNAAGNTYNVYVQGAANMNPDIQYIRLKFEVLDFDPAEWGTNTLEDVDVYRFEPAEPDPARKIATFMPPFNGWTGVSLSSPFGNATFGSNTTGLWIETPGPTAGANRTVDYALWQIAGASSGVAFEADRLYRSVWTISVPNTATEGTCARIRMIAGNQANNWGAEFVADPAGGYREHMPTVAGVEYSVWQETLPLLYSGSEAVLNNMSFLFDVADGREDQSGRIYLKKVDLFYYDIP